MGKILWRDHTSDLSIGATGTGAYYVVRHISANMISVCFYGDAGLADDYGPMVLVQRASDLSRWLGSGKQLYLVVASKPDAVTMAQDMCQWHSQHLQMWPNENIRVERIDRRIAAS